MRVIVGTEDNVISARRAKEQFGSWSENRDFSIQNVRVAPDDGEALRFGEEGYLIADNATEVHIISMKYTTGDSFGSSSGNGAIIAVFGDRKRAETAFEKISEQKDNYSIEVEDDLGRLVKISNPGAGYFEQVDELLLDTLSLDKAPLRKRFY